MTIELRNAARVSWEFSKKVLPFIIVPVLALWLISLGVTWRDRVNDHDKCIDYASATGFETRWKSYNWNRWDCLVRLNIDNIEQSPKFLPIEQVNVILTNEVT